MTDFNVTIADIRDVMHCARGTRAWFKTVGLDFDVFLKDGLPASKLLATGDGMAKMVIDKIVAAREADHG